MFVVVAAAVVSTEIVCLQVEMAVDVPCKALCFKQSDKKYEHKVLTKDEAKEFADKIRHDYYVHLWVFYRAGFSFLWRGSHEIVGAFVDFCGHLAASVYSCFLKHLLAWTIF